MSAHDNFKGLLNEYCTKRWRDAATYDTRRSALAHSDHKPVWDSTVKLPCGWDVKVSGVSGCARDAEQEAARAALEELQREESNREVVDRVTVREQVKNAIEQAQAWPEDEAQMAEPRGRKQTAHSKTHTCRITKVSHHWAEAYGIDRTGHGCTFKLKGVAMIGARVGDELEVRAIPD